MWWNSPTRSRQGCVGKSCLWLKPWHTSFHCTHCLNPRSGNAKVILTPTLATLPNPMTGLTQPPPTRLATPSFPHSASTNAFWCVPTHTVGVLPGSLPATGLGFQHFPSLFPVANSNSRYCQSPHYTPSASTSGTYNGPWSFGPCLSWALTFPLPSCSQGFAGLAWESTRACLFLLKEIAFSWQTVKFHIVCESLDVKIVYSCTALLSEVLSSEQLPIAPQLCISIKNRNWGLTKHWSSLNRR